MKNLLKKNTDTTSPDDLFDTSRKAIKKSAIKNGIACGIDIATVIATPVAVMNVTEHIDDDYAKKALYVTGGLLWGYQISSAIRHYSKTAAMVAGYKLLKVCDEEAIAETSEEIQSLIEEMEESDNDQNKEN